MPARTSRTGSSPAGSDPPSARVAWNGAGGCEIVSHSRHVNFSRTVGSPSTGAGSPRASRSRPRRSWTAAPTHSRRRQSAPGTPTARAAGARGRACATACGRTKPLTCMVSAAAFPAASSSSVAPRLEFVQDKLKLIEKALLALRPRAIECPTELLDHQRQRTDLGFRIGRLGLGRRRARFGGGKRSLQRLNVQVAPCAHGAGSESDAPRSRQWLIVMS